MGTKEVNVLLVEDEQRDSRLVQAMLGAVEAPRFAVEEAASLSEGMERTAEGDIDIVLLDLSLPDSRGMETFNRLHKQAPGIPIVVMTGLDDEDIATKAVKEGAQDYLIKGQVEKGMLSRALTYAIERKEAERALRESEEKYRSVVERATDGIVIVQDEVIKYANPRSAALLGMSPEEMIGTPLTDYMPLDEAPQILESYNRQMAGGDEETIHDGEALHIDGHRIEVEINASGFSYEARPAVLVMFRDVSERRQIGETIRNRLKLEKATSTIFSRFVLVEDLDDAISQSLADLGTLRDANRAYLFLINKDAGRMSNTHEWCSKGIVPEKEVRQNLECERFHWWLRELKVQKILQIDDVANMPKEGKQEQKILKRQGIKSVLSLPIWIQGELAGFVGFDSVTELKQWNSDDVMLLRMSAQVMGNALSRKMAEDALRESEAKYVDVVERANDGITIIQNLAIQYANPRALDILGYTPEELLGTPMANYIHPDKLAQATERYNRRLAGERVESVYESTLLHKDGHSVDVELSAGAIMYRGEPADLVVARDITERRRSGEELRRSEEKLRDLVEKLRLSQEALSTPVVQIWDKVLALPLIGVMDDYRAQQVMEVLLTRIVDTQSELVIIDVTGVASIDTGVANHLLQTINSVSLLGARCVLTGIQPEVAQTVITLGLDMKKMIVKRDMQDGLRWALSNLGYSVKNGQATGQEPPQPLGPKAPKLEAP
jgi:PAS domain S-box-containing protein